MGDMLSRDEPSEASKRTPSEIMFATWRLMLTQAFARVRRPASSAWAKVRAHASGLVNTLAEARSGAGLARTRVAVSGGVLAIAVGIVLSVALAPSGESTRTVATALMAAAWVAARYPAMRIAASRAHKQHGAGIASAWAAGALLHLAAVTPELRFVTWAAGAVLSWRALRKSGYPGREAAAIVGVGYGLEATGFVLLVLFRSLRVGVLLLGGGA